MPEFDAAHYGDRWAREYDSFYGEFPEQRDCVCLLAELAGDGPALELGIGTGRVALPLAATGLDVSGVESSAAMISQLREKPGGTAITVHKGDFASFSNDVRYSLVYVVVNTLYYLTSQDEQVACVANVAHHLANDGVFVVEAAVPWTGSGVEVADIGADGCTLYVHERLPVSQRVVAHFVRFHADGSVMLLPDTKRYIWPSELDLMARMAGLRLRDRWGGWQREPFTARSAKHVTVYAREDATDSPQ